MEGRANSVVECAVCKNRITAPELKEENELEKCRMWLENCTTSESASVCSCDPSSSDLTNTDCTSTTTDDLSYNSEGLAVCDKVCTYGNDEIELGGLQLGGSGVKANVYQNVMINKSKKVHLGNVTYIQGPIYVNQTSNVLNQITNTVTENENRPQITSSAVRWVDRKNWLAQPPLAEYTKLKTPAKYVIICHSATEEGEMNSDNILLVRIIQQFHIESRGWDDIGYNFLIGRDGNTYVGRGWGIQGAHTQGYNRLSVGLCFVGCFINHLPSQAALRQAKALIELGVAEGHIETDYSLIGASQCHSTESPGRTLFGEIRTWPHWDESVSTETPSPLLIT